MNRWHYKAIIITKICWPLRHFKEQFRFFSLNLVRREKRFLQKIQTQDTLSMSELDFGRNGIKVYESLLSMTL